MPTRHAIPVRHLRRRAFTLVEMLVAVGLAVLMMAMFATIFSLATGSLSRQKGLAENDQRARMLMTLLKSDLDKRTFRDIVPFEPGDDTTLAPLLTLMANRRGYFEFSENDPNDPTDDVLRFTIDSTITTKQPDVTALYGRATFLKNNGGVGDQQFFLNNPNQPEADDGQVSLNSVGSSTAGEIVYFLRAGRLYRRQMLIRKPFAGTETQPEDAQSTPARLIIDDYNAGEGSSTNASGCFWRDFDYSTFYKATGPFGPKFHELGALANTSGLSADPDVLFPLSLGIPHLRFGHSLNISGGAPLEFVTQFQPTGGGALQTGGRFFIGSFTHEETSHNNFRHPGVATTGMNDPFRMTLTLDQATGAVQQLQNGPRIGEDLLLSNVLAFDIQVWDPGAGTGPDGQPGRAGIDDDSANGADDGNETGWPGSDDGDWVDLGSDSTGMNDRSFYRLAFGQGPQDGTMNRSVTNYGNRFDTWHADWAGGGTLNAPPYRAAVLNGTRQPLRAIRIRLQFLDISSQLVKELTIVQSLRDEPGM